jgi:predicted branched-subunit amino acid permease
MKNRIKNDELVLGGSPYALGLLKNKYTVFLEGFRAGYPLLIGFFPYAVAMSLLAQEVGMSFTQYFILGLLVYAGSAQLIACGMLLAGIGFVPIFLSALVCNLRYFLLTGSMSEMTKGWSKKQKALIYFFTTDESYALLSNKYAQKGRALSFAHSLGLTCMGILATSTALYAGQQAQLYFKNLNNFGFDFAVVAVFVAMLAFSIRNKKLLCIALISGSVTIFCKQHGFGSWGAVISTISVSSIYAYLDTLKEKNSPPQGISKHESK